MGNRYKKPKMEKHVEEALRPDGLFVWSHALYYAFPRPPRATLSLTPMCLALQSCCEKSPMEVVTASSHLLQPNVKK